MAVASAGCDFNKFMGDLFPPPMTPQTLEQKSRDPDFRRDAINRVVKRDSGKKEPWLKAYAMLLRQDGDPTVRAAAARALGTARATEYTPDLVEALAEDKSDMVRWDAAVALDAVPGESAPPVLMEKALADESDQVRAASAKALRHYRTPKVVATLVECLNDNAFAVRYRARQSLRDISGRDYGYEADEWAPIVHGDVDLDKPPHRRPWWDWFGVTDPDS